VPTILQNRGGFLKTLGIYISLVAGLLLFSSAGYADGNELLQRCTEAERLMDGGTPDDPFDTGVCLGWLDGVRKTLDVVKARAGDEAAFNTCIPDSVTTGQNLRVVLAYLRDNPAKLHQRELLLTVLALKEAFPCSSSDS
jgi:hypothetical protein